MHRASDLRSTARAHAEVNGAGARGRTPRITAAIRETQQSEFSFSLWVLTLDTPRALGVTSRTASA
jgi:hypothetical protein